MHRLLIVTAALWVAGCSTNVELSAPPLDRLYFPAGIAHVKVPGKTNGVLLVANANGDKRYGSGSIVALDLDAIEGVPAMGTQTEVAAAKDLKLTDAQRVQIGTFGGELNVAQMSADTFRVYVPTRAEGNRFFQAQLTIDAQGVPALSCVGEGAVGQNCVPTGVSLTPLEFEQSKTGVPRAPQPYGVTSQPRACTAIEQCCPGGVVDGCERACTAGQCLDAAGLPLHDVWVTHLFQADSPTLSGANYRGYLVHFESDDFTVSEDNFVPIGYGASNSAVALGEWVYVSGRIAGPAPNLLRLVSRDGSTVLSTALESYYRVSDARSLALSSNKSRLFMVGRVPDTLLVTNLTNATTSSPTVSFVRGVSMPDAANDVRVIARAGKGDLVVVSGASITAGAVAIYDDDVGDVVALISGVGVQPSSLAIDHRGTSARIYAANFGDGRIAVIDIPNLSRPQEARLVAHLGGQQLCLVRGNTSPGCVASGEAVP